MGSLPGTANWCEKQGGVCRPPPSSSSPAALSSGSTIARWPLAAVGTPAGSNSAAPPPLLCLLCCHSTALLCKAARQAPEPLSGFAAGQRPAAGRRPSHTGTGLRRQHPQRRRCHSRAGAIEPPTGGPRGPSGRRIGAMLLPKGLQSDTSRTPKTSTRRSSLPHTPVNEPSEAMHHMMCRTAAGLGQQQCWASSSAGLRRRIHRCCHPGGRLRRHKAT